MATQSNDTHPEMERYQIMLIRKASIPKRLAKTRSLSSSMIQLSKRAIQRAHPDFDQRDVDLTFLEVHYGNKLSEAVRDYLTMRRP
jgi:retron-type reverse transcriptase